MSRKYGTTIGDVLMKRYLITAHIGEGGMSAVFLADDLRLKGKKWAVKETYLFKQKHPSMDEVNMLIQLSHPQLPNIVDYIPPNGDGFSYLIMDYIKGQTLQQRFTENNGKIPFNEIIQYAIQVCDLFQYLHHHQPRPIIYRDLKPSNVMIDESNHIRLIDFGIARKYEQDKDADTVHIGTFGFAAPELLDGMQTDHRSDLYSLGAMLYFLLSNGNYYNISLLPLTEFRDDLPKDMYPVVGKLLMKNPDERFLSAKEVKTVLIRISDKKKFSKASKLDKYGEKEQDAPKLIIVGSLYAGAGATFTTLSLAYFLNQYRISHAVVEYPENEPEYYMLLDGEWNAPKNYAFLMNDLAGDDISQKNEWKSGYTSWKLLHPEGTMEEWNREKNYKLLYSLKQSTIIFDISNQWNNPLVFDLCKEADELLLVVDPSPAKIARPSSQKLWDTIMQLKDSGKSIHCIANRNSAKVDKKAWMQLLPVTPSCWIPNIPNDWIQAWMWKGNITKLDKKMVEILEPSIHMLASKMFTIRQTEEKLVWKRLFPHFVKKR